MNKYMNNLLSKWLSIKNSTKGYLIMFKEKSTKVFKMKGTVLYLKSFKKKRNRFKREKRKERVVNK